MPCVLDSVHHLVQRWSRLQRNVPTIHSVSHQHSPKRDVSSAGQSFKYSFWFPLFPLPQERNSRQEKTKPLRPSPVLVYQDPSNDSLVVCDHRNACFSPQHSFLHFPMQTVQANYCGKFGCGMFGKPFFFRFLLFSFLPFIPPLARKACRHAFSSLHC